MTRTPEQIIEAMAASARLTQFRDDATWRDALFEASGDGWKLSRPGDPDRAALAALADEFHLLDEHVATLPRRLHVAWLQEILGIQRLPVVPDRVIASATVDAKVAPVVIDTGTTLRGGKDAFGNERRYRTLDALTAHGATLSGVRVLLPDGEGNGMPLSIYSAPEFPIVPTTDLGPGNGAPAPFVMRITSPVLGFPEGSMKVSLGFIATNVPGGPARIATLRDAALWRHPRADGTMSAPIAGTGDGFGILVSLNGGCVDPNGGDPWIECIIHPDKAVPEGTAFHNVQVAVVERMSVVPDAAFAGEGAVDFLKEFEPFPATAARGDAFYVRSDEVLSKKVNFLKISVEEFAPRTGGAHSEFNFATGVMQELTVEIATAAQKPAIHIYKATMPPPPSGGTPPPPIGGTVPPPPPPTPVYGDWSRFAKSVATSAGVLQWQRMGEDGWVPFGSPRSSFGNGEDTISDIGSRISEVSGQRGRYVRALITQNDLGWKAYQTALASFASAAVMDPKHAPMMPMPITPAIFRNLRIQYTTSAVPATRVESWSGWRHLVWKSGIFQPFRREVASGRTGMVSFGLGLPLTATGSSVSLYVELDSPSPCKGNDEGASEWQWWDGSEWQKLLVADGTHRMRESGLVRFIAPHGWAEGCADVTADVGRWLRFATNRPDRIGVIHAAIPDAVVAEFVSSAPDPQTDPSSANALPVGTVKGTLGPIAGVKKVTNLASVRGRGPEDDNHFTRRAAAQVRHRGRAITAWDYEQMVAIQFPEVAAVRCLPHTDSAGHPFPGSVGLVVIPDRPDTRDPRPSVSLAGRIQDALTPAMPVGALISIMCPEYVSVRVEASIKLRRGIAAITGKANVTNGLETLLHPTGTAPTRWGVSLYASSLIAALERLPEVDSVQSFKLFDPLGQTEAVLVDECRGMYYSSGDHALTVEEQL